MSDSIANNNSQNGSITSLSHRKSSSFQGARSFSAPSSGSNLSDFQEETPKMSSVKAASPGTALDSSSSLHKAPRFGFPRPLTMESYKCLSRKNVLPANNPEKTISRHNSDEPNPYKLKTTSSNWKVPNSALRTPPEYFLLDKTSRFVNCTNATIVSTRISECLRNRSIEATFDDAKAKAKCKNSDLAKFRVRLFLGTGRYENHIVVEVQRRSGSIVSFSRDCRAILNAASMEEGEIRVDAKRSCAAKRHVLETDLFENKKIEGICGEETITALERKSRFDCAFGVASRLLQKNDRDDATNLGLECLRLLTDRTKTSVDCSRSIVTTLLDEENESTFETVFSHVQLRLPSHGHYKNIDDDRIATLESRRHLALAILCNIVKAMFEAGTLSDAIKKQHVWFVGRFMPLLINLLKTTVQSHPHDSFLAVEALFYLFDVSIEARNGGQDGGVMLALYGAIEFGSSHHVLLAKASLRCKSSLECL